jgi:DNA invertase Pin-like site-specific DNA recombinase
MRAIGYVRVSTEEQGSSGTSDISAGTYTNVQVNALGNWTIKFVPK